MAKKPTKISPPTTIDASFKLTEIEKRIIEFSNFAKVAGPGKEAALGREHAKFLIRDLLELKKEKDLTSRVSAVKLLYENYNDWLKKLPDEVEEEPGKKDGANPDKVVVKGKTACPKGCDEKLFDELVGKLKKTKSFEYTKSTRSWTPDLGKQTGHADGKGWKAYVDAEGGSGTKWRMGFDMLFDEAKDVLTVDINYCKIGH